MPISWMGLRVVVTSAALFLMSTGADAQSISVLSDVAPGAGGSNPSQLVVAGNDICFLAGVGGDDELWCSDGTDAGTRVVSDSLPGVDFSNTTVAAAGSSRFVSAIRGGAIGWELYAISDTDVGTGLDINPGGFNSEPRNLYGFGNILLFSAVDGVHGRELWRSDGTPGGTFMVADLNPGAGDSSPAEFARVGNQVFFAATDGVNGTELWKTDGTEIGTLLVSNVASGASPSGPNEIVDLQGDAIFVSTFDSFLMRSDGTPGGTQQVLQFSGPPKDLTVIGGVVYFAGTTGAAGSELWVSDGSPGGTTLVKDILPGGFSTLPALFTDLGNQVLFRARLGGGADHELWRTEGTDVSTERVLAINPAGLDEVSDLRALGNLVYFAASNGPHGIELWQSDGTADGTIEVIDLHTGGGSLPRELTVFKGRLFFVATGMAEGREVFVLRPPSAAPGLAPAAIGLLVALLGSLGVASVRRKFSD